MRHLSIVLPTNLPAIRPYSSRQKGKNSLVSIPFSFPIRGKALSDACLQNQIRLYISARNSSNQLISQRFPLKIRQVKNPPQSNVFWHFPHKQDLQALLPPHIFIRRVYFSQFDKPARMSIIVSYNMTRKVTERWGESSFALFLSCDLVNSWFSLFFVMVSKMVQLKKA